MVLDTFVLGDEDDGVFYQGLGFARIQGFDWTEGDKFQAAGNQGDYSLSYGNWHGSADQDKIL
ncbi:hypothetical protein H1P_3920007 [Hyella patelloides LEGE 07179]|uniref:Uncharacterized protein n=1 Tax=Hyella patelloides LEGE 07179 TaxID=945734 RepID=A0A563VX15_9CYAN|nr:hypothetical protein [Hyella patelloides]VEP15979.1 hypothetical protein H1P_3920007 [Hyella patelloides LEGE 07179]